MPFDKAEYARLTEGFEIHSTIEDEGGFSWSACETCGDDLGGNRTRCALTNPGVRVDGTRHPIVYVQSCDNCIYFAAYGELPEEQ